MKSRALRLAVLVCLLALGTLSITAANVPARTPDPKPPQVSVFFLYPPSPLIQHGQPRLVYEMQITNYIPAAYVLDGIDVKAGSKTFTYTGDKLRSMMRFLGEAGRTPENRRLEAGRSVIVYFMLTFDKEADIPSEIEHTLHFTAPDGSRHALAAPLLTVTRQPPVVVGAPLRGPNWIAGDSMHNGPDAAHRRTILLLDGRPWLAQRYAIDWVRYRMINGMAATWSEPEDKNSSYFCYDAPIYSVAAGKVVEVMDGVPENVPHSGKYAVDINFINAGGNHVVVDIGGGHYAFYAHMRPGSVKVKVGEHVSAGQILGHVGNTGSSTEPHLHMHIVDRPSFLAGHGIPYEFAHFKASPATELVVKAHEAWFFKNIGPLKSFTDDYPAENAAVSFPKADAQPAKE